MGIVYLALFLRAKFQYGRVLASGSQNGDVKVMYSRTLLQPDELRGAQIPTRHHWRGICTGRLVTSLAFTNRSLILCRGDGVVRVRDLDSLTTICVFDEVSHDALSTINHSVVYNL